MSGSLLKDRKAHSFLKTLSPLAAEPDFSIKEPAHTGAQLKAVSVSAGFPLENGFNYKIKRLVDIIISCSFIILFFPWLIPLIALLIKLDSKGPVFFLQRRNKMNGDVFTCIKFRSMVMNKEADLLPASENDYRITRVGKFLRKHHLDELPQLFNVWLGDMSIIGPRPHMITDNQKFEDILPYYHYRHQVKPGITGLAQILGYVGPVTDTQNIKARVDQDIYYVYNWSFALDTKIACHTIFKIVGLKQIKILHQ